ncbi:MAG: hypothetical protein R6U96_19125 [Promethearchaeia archaeon]
MDISEQGRQTLRGSLTVDHGERHMVRRSGFAQKFFAQEEDVRPRYANSELIGLIQMSEGFSGDKVYLDSDPYGTYKKIYEW